MKQSQIAFSPEVIAKFLCQNGHNGPVIFRIGLSGEAICSRGNIAFRTNFRFSGKKTAAWFNNASHILLYPYGTKTFLLICNWTLHLRNRQVPWAPTYTLNCDKIFVNPASFAAATGSDAGLSASWDEIQLHSSNGLLQVTKHLMQH